MSVNIEHHEKSGCGQQKTRKFRLLSIVNFHVDVIRHIFKLAWNEFLTVRNYVKTPRCESELKRVSRSQIREML